MERGTGERMVVLHGTSMSSLVLHGLLSRLDGVRITAVDRPGHGLSGYRPFPLSGFRAVAVGWVDEVLEDSPPVTLLGHSMGGLWALWFTMTHPERVNRLILIGGAPALPMTRAPIPFRVLATPVLGEVMRRMPASPKSIATFAKFVGEETAVDIVPEMVDVLVAANEDPVASQAAISEIRAVLSPHMLVNPTAWRPAAAVTMDELSAVSVPTLIIWGRKEPLASADTAQRIANQFQNVQFEVVEAGHVPWWTQPDRSSELVERFMRG